MRILLIRHGETQWNSENRCQGFSDIELNEKGREQAKNIALSLQDEELSAVYASPLKRARETASEIAESHRLDVRMDAGLKEINQGDFEGLKLSELAKHREFLSRWFNDPATLKMPNGECMEDVQSRAWQALEGIMEEHKEGQVAVVSHNLCISTILCKVLHLDLAYFRRLRQDIAGVSTIESGGRWPHPVLIALNDTCHLKTSVADREAS